MCVMGWAIPDHVAEDTITKYGHWCVFFIFVSLHVADHHTKKYPLLIDVVIQSSAVGFVSMDHLTMSLLVACHLQDWSSSTMHQLFHFNIFVQSLYLSPEAHLAHSHPKPSCLLPYPTHA